MKTNYNKQIAIRDRVFITAHLDWSCRVGLASANRIEAFYNEIGIKIQINI